MDVLKCGLTKVPQLSAYFTYQPARWLHATSTMCWRNPRNQRAFFRRPREHSTRFPTEYTSKDPRTMPVSNSALPDEFANYRFMFPEFLPVSDITIRQPLKEYIERQEMLKRRTILEIPEFYVGSKMAVTISDPLAPGKVSRFVGLCIAREGQGLKATFTLRNIIENEGVEICYDLYNPTIRSIEVLKLEKRLDDHLYYLRDAPQHYSEVPFDLEPEVRPENAPVPVNETRVKLNPHPWSINWQNQFHILRGIESLEQIPQSKMDCVDRHRNRFEHFDLMKDYRENIPEEDQLPIWREIKQHNAGLEDKRREERRKKFLKKN